MIKTQNLKKGWAFTLTLVLVVTTLFGGFGSLGIKGAVGEVHASPEPGLTAYSAGAPAGTTEAPTTYTITTEAQLRELATTVSSGSEYENTTFELTHNITISDTPWLPIGIAAKPFSGTFDGKDKKITGVKIGTSDTHDTSYIYAGLFGYTSGGAIENLGVDVQINSSRANANIGGLVGLNYNGTITNCYATGNVAGGSKANIGGLVGRNYKGTINNCYTTSILTGANGNADGYPTEIGGLVGWNHYGTINNCYATGDVSGGDYTYVGGLAGYSSDGTINNCYATGNITAGNDVILASNGTKVSSMIGGMVGFNQRATILNCYATGDVTGGTDAKIGGFVGTNQDNQILNGYWNSDAIQILSGAAVVNKLGVGLIYSGSVITTSMGSIAMKDLGFVTTLNNWVSNQGDSTYYTWKAAANDSDNGGYPLLDAEWKLTPTYTMGASSLAAFASQTIGYVTAPVAQTITITNTGNQVITLTQPTSTNYDIGALSSTNLSVGGTATFTVQPKTGLAVGTYPEAITITGSNGAVASVSAQFSVTAAGGSGSTSGGSSSSSGSGSSSSTPTTVINNNTGNITGEQLKNAVGAAKDGETITIKSDKTSEVTLQTSGLSSLTGKNNSLTVVTKNGTLTFDNKAIAAIGKQATATAIKLIIDDVVKTTLTKEQQTKVVDKAVYDLTVISGSKHISNFKGGKVKVSIPYELKKGEIADNVTVWYMADDGSLTEINCTYDTKNKSVTFVVDHFSKYIIGYDDLADWANPFTDVKNSAWYYAAAAFVNVNGLMKGQTDTAFGPQAEMTRGMFVSILGRMEGVDTTIYANKNTLSDVKSNQYYTPYIAWAIDKGIVTGIGGDKFAPNAAVTREQMAVMMTNYMKFKGQGPTGAWAIRLTYGDLDKVSSWANEGVMFMTMKNLMKGMGSDAKGNDLFDPNATSTRAQTAQVMMNLEELLK